MAKRIGSEAKIIALFSALPEDSKRIVMDLLRAQTATSRPKSAAPSVKQKSSRKKEGDVSIPNTATEMDDVGGVNVDGTLANGKPRYVPICVTCGNEESHEDHQPESSVFHKFRTEIRKKGAGASV